MNLGVAEHIRQQVASLSGGRMTQPVWQHRSHNEPNKEMSPCSACSRVVYELDTSFHFEWWRVAAYRLEKTPLVVLKLQPHIHLRSPKAPPGLFFHWGFQQPAASARACRSFLGKMQHSAQRVCVILVTRLTSIAYQSNACWSHGLPEL